MSTQPLSPGREEVERQFAQAQSKLDRLRLANPYLLDVSLREPCVSAPIGHTLQNKIALLGLADQFGIKDKLIATLDYQLPDHPEVEDDFCCYLRDTGHDMTGFFAFSAVGTTTDGVFTPDLSMQKLVDYRVPNTLHEIYLLPVQQPTAEVLNNLCNSLQWLRTHVSGDHGGPCRIYVNIVDLIDTFYADRELACQVLECLAQQQVDAVSFEDGRGTFFPFQVSALVTSMKALLTPNQKVLFHLHTGNGMENAATIEALLAGADGYWGGLDKESSTIGHASISELVGNLVRIGNQQVTQQYRVDQMADICKAMHLINTEENPPDDWPIQGTNAYCQMLSAFEQRPDRFMDLPPTPMGEHYSYRIAPVVSDVPVIQGRMWQALGIALDEPTAVQMILLMRQDLRDGWRIRYNEPDQLRTLYQRALQLVPATAA